jgi:hypothetical protein
MIQNSDAKWTYHTSISLPSPPRPARGRKEAAAHELKKNKPAANSLFEDADAEDLAPCFHRRSHGAIAADPRTQIWPPRSGTPHLGERPKTRKLRRKLKLTTPVPLPDHL